MIFFVLRHAGVEALALLRDDVQEERVVVVLGEIEGLDEQRQVVAVDRAVIGKAHILENEAGAMPVERRPLTAPSALRAKFLPRFAA